MINFFYLKIHRNITGNPLICNCDIWWLLRITRFKIVEPLKCDSPANLRGQLIRQVNQDRECEWYNRPTLTLHLHPDEDQVRILNEIHDLECKNKY